jgi:hypothetical protein
MRIAPKGRIPRQPDYKHELRSRRPKADLVVLLKTSGAATRIVWLLFRGAAQRTRDALDRMRIEWYDIEWDPK